MATADQLVAWLDGTATATIERRNETIRLTYTDEAVDRWGLGEPVLSCSLLTSTTKLDATAFVDVIDPQGPLANRIATARDRF